MLLYAQNQEIQDFFFFLQNPKGIRPNEKAAPSKTAGNVESKSNQQPSFSCYLCPFEAISRELLEAHLFDEHNLFMTIDGDVKLENVGDVSSTMPQATEIKMEPILHVGFTKCLRKWTNIECCVMAESST